METKLSNVSIVSNSKNNINNSKIFDDTQNMNNSINKIDNNE